MSSIQFVNISTNSKANYRKCHPVNVQLACKYATFVITAQSGKFWPIDERISHESSHKDDNTMTQCTQ